MIQIYWCLWRLLAVFTYRLSIGKGIFQVVYLNELFSNLSLYTLRAPVKYFVINFIINSFLDFAAYSYWTGLSDVSNHTNNFLIWAVHWKSNSRLTLIMNITKVGQILFLFLFWENICVHINSKVIKCLLLQEFAAQFKSCS